MSAFGNSTQSPFAFTQPKPVTFTQPKPVAFTQPKPQSHSVFGSSQPITTAANSEEQIEESKAIIAILLKIETIMHDLKKDLTSLGISEDLRMERHYIKYIRIYTDLIEETLEKKIRKDHAKFRSLFEKLEKLLPRRT
jgi:hypothetical protein